MSRTISLEIDSIASGGDGVGRSEGLVVFVPRTAPGDLITAGISGKGHFARGALRNLLRASEDRIDPPCPHYTRDRCGGCQIQHIRYESQLSAKSRIIADALRRIGKREVDAPEVEPSKSEWRYRTKLTLAMRRRGANWIAGLHAYDDPGRVFALADCPITDRRIVTVWRDILAAGRFLPDVPALRGSVRWTDDGPTFVLIGGTRWANRDDFFAAVPVLVAVYWEPVERPRELVGDRRAHRTPAASFAQVNPTVAGSLRSYVIDRITALEPGRVVDGYAGAGDLAASLAERGITVEAIELDRDASDWAESRLAPPSRAICGRVEEVLPRLESAPVTVSNPPRAGLHESVSAHLDSDARARHIVYVSCDPATLARDVARMPLYEIESIRAFDMFPQTSHVETVVMLRRSE